MCSLTARRLLFVACLLPVLLACLAGAAGCAGIAPGEDPVLVNAERTVAAAYQGCDAFLQAEHANRDKVRKDYPAIHAAAERLRRDGPALFREARAITKAYKASPDPDTTEALNAKVEAVQAWARFAAVSLQQIRGGL
jgi:hypothetical protein